MTTWRHVPLPPGVDVEQARGRVLVDAYLGVFLDGAPVPEDALQRDLLRLQVAQLMHNGRGAYSDADFLREMKRDRAMEAISTEEREAAGNPPDLLARLTMTAQHDALPAGVILRRPADATPPGHGQPDLIARLHKFHHFHTTGIPGRNAANLEKLVDLARKGNVFDPTWSQPQVTAMYGSLLGEAVEDSGLTADDLDDIVRHQVDAQREDVSRDAFGALHFRNRVVIRGVEAMRRAVEDADHLSPLDKATLTDGLPQRHARFVENLVTNVMRDMPELAAALGVRSVEDYWKITTALNDSVPEQFMGGFNGAADSSIGGMYHLLGHAEGWVTPDSRTPLAERRSRRLKDNSTANFQLNELSRTYHREQTTFLGLDAGHYGQGAWGAVESVAITGLTAPLVPAFTVANHARLTLALNSAAKVMPAAAIFGTRKGISTYDEAIAAGKTEAEALRLAWTSGVMEGAITAAFNAAGAGGIEGIASGSARELFRHTMRQSVTSTWLAGAKEFTRGTLGEVGEEVLIEALDTAFVQMSLRPDMTIAEFFKKLHDTALVTTFASAPSSAVHGVNAVRDVRGNNRRIETEMGTSPTRQESVAPPQEDTRSDPEAGDIAAAPADHDERSALEVEVTSKIDITAAGDYQNDADIPNHPRMLEQTDLDPDGSLHELKGTLNTTDGIAIVRLDMMRGAIKNPFKAFERLSAAARSQGATTLRIEATLANERLYDILRKRYKMTTEGSKDIINIPLE